MVFYPHPIYQQVNHHLYNRYAPVLFGFHRYELQFLSTSQPTWISSTEMTFLILEIVSSLEDVIGISFPIPSKMPDTLISIPLYMTLRSIFNKVVYDLRSIWCDSFQKTWRNGVKILQETVWTVSNGLVDLFVDQNDIGISHNSTSLATS